jgi:hypothetical protein
MSRFARLAFALLIALGGPALAQSGGMSHSGGMKMPTEMAHGPAHFQPTRQAYTSNRQFLVKLLAVPQPIPFEKYFDLRFAVYDGHHPQTLLPDATVTIAAGMRHGLKHGFAHGMESSPKEADKSGVITVSGMYFHMMGAWTLKLTVRQAGKTGTAYFRLPCCGK